MRLGKQEAFPCEKWLQSGEITLNFCRNQRNNGFSALKTPKKFDKKGLSWHNKEDERNQSAGAWERSGGGK